MTLWNYLIRYRILLLIVVISFILRLSFRSNYLDDWDSVQYAIAINNYSIADHQPQPPGYPIYILFGRIIYLFIHNPTQSLTFVGILFGSLSLIPSYLLAEKFFDKNIANLSAIILSLTPGHLLFSEVAMTDIVSLFFVGTTVYLLYLGLDSKRYFYIASIVLGLTAGIRTTDIILLVLFLIVLIYKIKSKKLELKEIVISISLVILGICIWLIPIIIDTGIDKFITRENDTWESNRDSSTINKVGLLKTFEVIINLFVKGWSIYLYIFFIFILILLIHEFFIGYDFKQENIKLITDKITDKRFIFISVWVMIYSTYSILFNDLTVLRFLLPQFIPLSIIFAYSMIRIVNISHKKFIKISLTIFYGLLIILMGNQALAGAYALHETIPAPIKTAEFIKNNYNPENVVIVSKDSYRHFQYYLPNFIIINIGMEKKMSYQDIISDEIYRYILDNKTILSEDAIIFDNYKEFDFKREKVYTKHEYVDLYQYEDLNKRSIFFIGNGWYKQENWNNKITRWMSNDAILRLYSDDDRNNILNFNTLSFNNSRTLEIYVNNIKIDQVNVTKEFNGIKIPITIKKGLNIIRFHSVEGCDVPSNILRSNTQSINLDNRCISMAFQNMILK